MTKKIFTKEEILILSKNSYVKKVSEKGITYTDEFKRIFISENEKGKLPKEIFEEHDFDIDIIGMKRVESSGKRWRAAYRKNGHLGLKDKRTQDNSNQSKKKLSINERYKILKDQNRLLKAEIEYLKSLLTIRG